MLSNEEKRREEKTQATEKRDTGLRQEIKPKL